MLSSTVYHYALAIITVVCGIFVLSDIENTAKEKLPKKVMEIVLAVAASTALTVVLMGIFEKNGLPTLGRLAVVASLGLYATFLCKYKLYTKFAVISIYYSANIIIRDLSSILRNVIGITTNNASISNLTKLLVFTAVLVLTGIFIKRYKIGSTSASSRGFWAVFITVILVHDISRIIIDIAMESGILTNESSRYLERFFFEAIILIFNLLAYYLIYKLTTYYAQKEELARLRQRQSDIMSEVARANQMYDEMRVLRHEFKNNMLTVRGLSKTKQYDKLDQYLSSYLKTDGMALGYIDCGNKVLNNILNFKYADLTSRGVAFNHKVSVPEELPYDESDITSLLVNLIDNAAEAGLKTESPSVDMNVIVEKGYCFITVINPVKDDILNENPTLQTTKKDKKSHGIGLKVVRNIVDKYDGYVNFEQKGGEFIASVMLSLG